jgi:hypothetical protein
MCCTSSCSPAHCTLQLLLQPLLHTRSIAAALSALAWPAAALLDAKHLLELDHLIAQQQQQSQQAHHSRSLKQHTSYHPCNQTINQVP